MVTDNNTILFCTKHYSNIYKHFHPPLECAFSHATPKLGITFTHHSPDAEFISSHFNKIDDMSNVNLCPTDDLCLSC